MSLDNMTDPPIGFIELPEVNLSYECLKNPEKRKIETEKLIQCFTKSGFCLVTGLDGYQEDNLLKSIKWYKKLIMFACNN